MNSSKLPLRGGGRLQGFSPPLLFFFTAHEPSARSREDVAPRHTFICDRLRCPPPPAPRYTLRLTPDIHSACSPLYTYAIGWEERTDALPRDIYLCDRLGREN